MPLRARIGRQPVSERVGVSRVVRCAQVHLPNGDEVTHHQDEEALKCPAMSVEPSQVLRSIGTNADPRVVTHMDLASRSLTGTLGNEELYICPQVLAPETGAEVVVDALDRGALPVGPTHEQAFRVPHLQRCEPKHDFGKVLRGFRLGMTSD